MLIQVNEFVGAVKDAAIAGPRRTMLFRKHVGRYKCIFDTNQIILAIAKFVLGRRTSKSESICEIDARVCRPRRREQAIGETLGLLMCEGIVHHEQRLDCSGAEGSLAGG